MNDHKSYSSGLGLFSDKKENTDYYLIDVDCLYDTRLILLSLIDEEYAQQVLEDGSFFTRVVDGFDGVPVRDFKNLYKQRGDNPQLLSAAPITNFHLVLQTWIKSSVAIARQGGTYNSSCFVINLYPYHLSQQDCDAIKEELSQQIVGLASVEIMWAADKEITPTYISGVFDCVTMYDGAGWIATHHEALQSRCCNKVFMAIPALYHDIPPTEEQIQKTIKEHKLHPLALTEVFLSPLMSVQLLPIEYFSIFNEHRKLAAMSQDERDQLFKLPKDLEDILSQE